MSTNHDQTEPQSSLTPLDQQDLEQAVQILLSPTLTAKLTGVVGKPLDKILEYLPRGMESKIQLLVKTALSKAADAALWSLGNEQKEASPKWNKAYAAISGGVGGFFGFTGLTVELPVSTTIMMRAVADIARSEGFDLEDADTKQACLQVFALGGESKDDDAAETTYYAMRLMTAEVITTHAGKWLSSLLEKVATRFGVVITEKAAAQAIPIVGAASGALINTMFTDFFQDMARGHFTVKRLEKEYGFDTVKAEFNRIAAQKELR